MRLINSSKLLKILSLHFKQRRGGSVKKRKENQSLSTIDKLIINEKNEPRNGLVIRKG